ncbi:MAG: hypothetical protein ACLFVJ_12095 [Persicimonas sp.]
MQYWSKRSFAPIACGAVLAGLLCGLGVSCGPNPEVQEQELQARVTLLNKTREMHVLRVRNLRNDVVLDCEQVRNAPDRYLRDDIFGAPVRWALYSDQEIGLGIDEQTPWASEEMRSRPCSAALVQSDTVADIVVFWDDSLETKTFVFDAGIPEEIKPDPQTVVLQADYSEVAPEELRPYGFRPCASSTACTAQQEADAAGVPDGARYEWESVHDQPLHFERRWEPIDQPDQTPEECRMPGGENSLAWSDVPVGRWLVDELSEGIDGCHSLELQDATNPELDREVLICMPFEALQPAQPSEDLRTSVRFHSISSTNAEGLRVEIEEVTGDAEYFGLAEVYLVRGSELPVGVTDVLDIEYRPRLDCPPVEAACGQTELPVDMRLATRSDAPLVRPGEASLPAQGAPRLFLMRSLTRPVLDPSCDDPVSSQLDSNGNRYFEAAVVIRN